MNWALPWLIFEVIICVLVLTMSRENPRYVEPIELKGFLETYSDFHIHGSYQFKIWQRQFQDAK